MRVLVVDEALPVPVNSGKRIRTVELLRRLAKDHRILLVAPVEGPTRAADLAELEGYGLEVRPVPRRPLVKRGWRFAWDLLRNVFLPVPYMVMGHRLRAVRAAVAQAAVSWKPDLVHVEWTPLVVNVPEILGLPVVISAHNVESDIWARYREAERGFLRRAYVALQHRKVARFEKRALGEADAVTAVSAKDGERIAAWTGQAHVTVAPNGVDAARFAPDPSVEVARHELVFVGSLDWRPNQDGVLWFLERVFPAIRARVPDATLVVVGRAPPPWFVERVSGVEGVRVEASVPDVRPFLARAAVAVVPLRVGGGSRLKICEALAMERPVVSTTVGAEGLDVGEGVVLADEPAAFADAVVATLGDPEGAVLAARAGRERALRTHEWGTVAPLVARAWAEAVARRRAAP